VKITLDIDCTPDEARAFLGLPDVKPMQEQLMQELQDRMSANIRAMAPDEMMKIWLPAGIASFEQMRELFLNAAKGKPR
jgi:hypothetical protein